ncbi:MAG: hypothetical protein JWN69_1224 [Alphaproteobacteria bacterium]|nr:hypothetical protein [Alphaproteobacteria bacterium]
MTQSINAGTPGHPIAIEPAAGRVVVTLGERTIADSANALMLREANYPPVYYIPRGDVDMALMQRTDHSTHCQFKGDASYYSIAEGGERSVNAAWSYEAPFEDVAAISGHLAFYPNRVDAIVETPLA